MVHFSQHVVAIRSSTIIEGKSTHVAFFDIYLISSADYTCVAHELGAQFSQLCWFVLGDFPV